MWVFLFIKIFIHMIEDILMQRYGEFILGLDIYESKSSLRLSKIIINKEVRSEGVGTKIMNDLVSYAETNRQIIVLTPSSDYGGNKNRLIQFYKRFGFKKNAGQYKNFEFQDDMIRYPRGLNENKLMIKKLLRENLLTDKKIICGKCEWSWLESESDKHDLYVCHKCGFDNFPKKTLNEEIMVNNKTNAVKLADFINFTKEFLDIDDGIRVSLAFERTPDLTTTAYYDYSKDGFIKVYAKDRAVVDICRSIAHELVHHKQFKEGRLLDAATDGADGSPIENEANSVAGVIMRKWGKLNPDIYK